MEMRPVAFPSGNPAPSPSTEAQSTEPLGSEKKKRVRRWHRRGFTGCLTCRRRHVRCDEASPSCKNCTRLGLDCDGTQGRMTFKVYGPSQGAAETSQSQNNASSVSVQSVKTQQSDSKPIKQEPEDDVDGIVISPTTMVEPTPVKYRFEDPISPSEFVPASLDVAECHYYTHFNERVSALLLIYDGTNDINPYQKYFPELARSSQSMASAMQALGALHLANTSSGPQRNVHFQQAMSKYGEVVKSFRTRYTQPNHSVKITDFATCLLLALFEMMDSQHDNWAIHLKGAREIYRSLFISTDTNPAKETQRLAESQHPLRHFLISLLSYLDVAGACNTSDGTVVEGSYWRAHGAEWEYNLGTPSLSSTTSNDNRLHDLRQSWSLMMEIQAAISAFGKAKHEKWLSYKQQDALYSELLERLVQWRANAPDSIQQLGEVDDESLHQYQYPEIVEYAGCIEAYEKATLIYLHKVVAADRHDHPSQRDFLEMLATRILTLIEKLAKDVGHLAVMWPLFIAGRETRDETRQKSVRQTMLDCQRFGFKNVDRALEELEKVWFKQRAFPEGWVDRMDDIRSSILLP
ncbi:Zn(II)2Cys6 transcription factor [Aspergillus clavatus NRRL 1]|uniref:C6 transcription factor, putative n=1 Tax=Aspergillus clavatus (strain ATCC 1007 / CBS 513.65 / DSM 816 / NCTC 3887 / NRRL 1 / QM 1276 / 107) TaxID=344612 RepID=A1C556_ASPCL|nr:C6 transcription factor, putative [Aspergillus clavatus NRRL 1]EAW14824.1 C6 transcription factor, putative [Aspergillus clavatus NRRL 1]